MTDIHIPSGISGLIFDCDGTLADTHHLHQEAWDLCLSAHGIQSPPDYLNAYRGVPTTAILHEFGARYGVELDIEAIAADKEDRVATMLDRSLPVRPVVEVARRHHGVLPMAVASGGTADNVHRTLRAIEVSELFGVVLTADDPIRGKPHPDIYLEAAKRIGIIPERCLVFEDSVPGMDAARAAGMAVVDVRPYCP